jgi:hypothetical protein
MNSFQDEFSPQKIESKIYDQENSTHFVANNLRERGGIVLPTGGLRGESSSTIASLISPEKNKKYNK